MLISSDDIHTGFDRSFLNKEEENAKKETEKQKQTITTTETLNNPQQSQVSNQEAKSAPKSDEEILDDLTVLPETAEFSKISSTKLNESAAYLVKNHHICTEQQKDALVMTAFDHQLQGDTKTTKQVIHQSLLLQYIAQLAGPHPSKDQTIKAIKLFISKVDDNSSPAKQAFLQDVDNTFNHIKNRCEVIRKEQEENQDGNGEEALIQLKALDDNTELFVNIPQEGTEEYNIFSNELSQEMQDAIKTGSLDEVNKIFAKLKVEDAEAILEVFNRCAVIGVNGYLEDEEEFKELQKQYNENLDLQENAPQPTITEENEVDTADIVD